MPTFNSCMRYLGRTNGAIGCSNAENIPLPEFETFDDEDKTRTVLDDSTILSVVDMNMYQTSNMTAHHTAQYNNSKLIVRRGQEFILGIVFTRTYDRQNDTVNIEFVIGNNPSTTQGTYITMDLNDTPQANKWKARVIQVLGNETQVGITPAADAIIGLFSIYVVIITSEGKKRTKRNPSTDVYVLFNPWAPLDEVFLDSEEQRGEYILNDVGIIYNGAWDSISSRPWNYGQFQKGILDACLFILDFGQTPLQYRGNAQKLVRKGSAMINSQDDNGVLVGNWGENMSLGTAPTAWTGSTEILTKYASMGGVPVKFAQCWVYAGVFNTFLRCLGLPARVITNYCSAHDNLGDLTTEIVLNETGQIDREATTDSVWNFHCWNEVFLKRPEIAENYWGWQVVDSTPQETSDGYYRCGPTSVQAIKEGQLGFQFDAPFVFAEVNSDVVIYKIDRYGNKKKVNVITNYVGKLILTKMVGSNQAQDITSTYKYPEGSAEDKQTMQRAMNKGMASDRSSAEEVEMQLHLQATQIAGTKNILLTITITNLNNNSHSISMSLTGKSDYYTGATRSMFKFSTFEATLDPWKTKQMTITVLEEEFKQFIHGEPFLSFILHAVILGTELNLTSMSVIHLNTPPLLIEVSGDNQVGKTMFVTVKFTNTASYDITNVTLRMEGMDILPVKTKMYSQINQGSTVKWMESFTPKTKGSKTVVACLDCDAMRNVCGQLDIVIQPEDLVAA